MEEQEGLMRWLKEHKNQLIIAGVSVGTLILIILGIKNKEKIMAVWDSLKGALNFGIKSTEEIEKINKDTPLVPTGGKDFALATSVVPEPFEVKSHVRNLPEGWKASTEKISEARKNNIILTDQQTWVNGYTKRNGAA